MLRVMSAPKPKPDKTIAPAVPGDEISDEEMDRRLADRRDEIDAKLQEAYADKARGDFAPLEPLEVLLREARERAKTGR
jgi:hypothetical protein